MDPLPSRGEGQAEDPNHLHHRAAAGAGEDLPLHPLPRCPYPQPAGSQDQPPRSSGTDLVPESASQAAEAGEDRQPGGSVAAERGGPGPAHKPGRSRPHAAAPCTALADSSLRVLSAGSRSTSLCLAPHPDHPPPMPPMGDTAPPGPSQPADLCPCTLLFFHLLTPNGAASVPLPHRDRTSSPRRSHCPLQVKAGGRKVPRPLGESSQNSQPKKPP